MLAIFQELNSKGPYLSSQKHKEYRCLVITSSIKGESKEFHVVVEQWRQTWRNIRKSQSQLIAFLPFSLTPPPSTLRKLRNFYDWTSPPIAIHVHILRPRKHESGCAETEYLIFASTRIRCGVFTLDSPPLPCFSRPHEFTKPVGSKKNPFCRAVSEICRFGVRIHWFCEDGRLTDSHKRSSMRFQKYPESYGKGLILSSITKVFWKKIMKG